MKTGLLLASLLASGAALPAAPGESSGKIKKIVNIMLENRSFAHMLGFLKSQNPDIVGLDGTETNPYDPADPSQGTVTVNDHAGFVAHLDPGHSITHTTFEVFGTTDDSADPAPMNGFVKEYEKKGSDNPSEIMACFNSTWLPVMSELAMEFGLMDGYFASVPGPTQVNRMYAMSGTSHGLGTNDKKHLIMGMPQKTIFESLDDAGLSWANYFKEVPGSLIFRYGRHPKHWKKFHAMEKLYEAFNSDDEDALPTFSWLEPAYFDIPHRAASDQHPDHDVSEGERLIKEIYENFVNSQRWNDTLLFINYDEHGGFYDNVSPPRPVPNPDGLNATDDPFSFDRIGVRVPGILISPWIPKGTVIHAPADSSEGQYEHTSVLATLEQMYGLEPLTKRDAWAKPFGDDIWSLDTPRTDDYPTTLPEPPSLRHVALPQTGGHPVSPLQQEWIQLAAALVGDLAEDGEGMTEAEGHAYVVSKVNEFLGREEAS